MLVAPALPTSPGTRRASASQRVLAAAAFGVLLPAPAFAQQAMELPPVSVTADPATGYRAEEPSLPKLRGPLQDTPQSITVVTEEVIEDQAATRVRDSLRNVPGITLNAGEGGAQGDNLTIRGFSGRGDFYMDGMRDIGSYNRDSFNLESLEVLKGPSSVLFGRGSTGGVVNQVSKTPKAAAFNDGSLSLGSNHLLRATADINQPLNASTALRLNAMAEGSEVAERDEAENRRFAVAPSLTLGLGGPTELTLSFLHQQEENVPDLGLPYLFGRPAPVSRSSFYGLGDYDYEDVVVDVATARLRHEFAAGPVLTNTLRYGRYGRDVSATAPRIAGNPAPGTPLGSILVNRSKNGPSGDSVTTALFNQTDIATDFATGPLRHAVSGGIELGRETVDSTRFTFTGVPQATLLDPNPGNSTATLGRSIRSDLDVSADTFAVYAMDRVSISERWELIAGLRWDRFDMDYRDRVTGAAFERTDEMLSGRAALVYKPLAWQSWYASYGTSFNPSAEFLALSATSAGLSPEENRTFEIGAKFDLLDGALALRGAVFRIEKTNARIPDPAGGGLQVLQGEQRVDGFELEVAGQITPWWNIIAGYAYLDSEIVESGNAAELGNRLPSTPEHGASLWSTVRLDPSWQVGGGVFLVGERYANAANTNKAEGYARVDAMVGYRLTDQVEVRFNVFNVFDTDYYDAVYTGHVVPGAGRTAVLSTSFRF